MKTIHSIEIREMVVKYANLLPEVDWLTYLVTPRDGYVILSGQVELPNGTRGVIFMDLYNGINYGLHCTDPLYGEEVARRIAKLEGTESRWLADLPLSDIDLPIRKGTKVEEGANK